MPPDGGALPRVGLGLGFLIFDDDCRRTHTNYNPATMSQNENPPTSHESQSSDGFDPVVDASGCLHIIRSFRMAIEPRALGFALVAIIATLLLGLVLDVIYLGLGGGVVLDAIDRFIENPSAVALDAAASSSSLASEDGGGADEAGEKDATLGSRGGIKKRPAVPAKPALTRQELKQRADDKAQADSNEAANPPALIAPDGSGSSRHA